MTSKLQLTEDLTRAAVPEVFQVMLSMELVAEPPGNNLLDEAGQIAGSVGFTGTVTGIVYLYAGLNFAKLITSRMLSIGIEEVDQDEMINDAFGELSNMVVGHVKSRLCDTGLTCSLTIPSIVRGQKLQVEGSAHVSRRIFGFHCQEHRLLVEVLVKD